MSRRKPAVKVGRVGIPREAVIAAFFTLSFVGFAVGASAAKIVDLSVIPQEASIELIFELDEPAGYRLERNQTSNRQDPDELLLSIDAEASNRELQTLGNLVAHLTVKNDKDGPTTIRIALREPGLVVRDSVLVNPPRLVLNISRPSGSEAVKWVPIPAAPAAFAQPAQPSPLAVLPAAEFSNAGAGNLREVRVGSHPTFSRLVFELDVPTSYRLDQKNGSELLIILGATSKGLNIRSKSKFISSVSVAKGDEKVIAHVRLNGDDLQIKEFVLSNPHRIVIDIGKR